MRHLTREAAIAYAEAKKAGIPSISDGHVGNCKRCSTSVQNWARLLDMLRLAGHPDPPEDVVNRSIALFEPRSSQPPNVHRRAM